MHPYTRSLLSAIPLPDPIYEKNRQRIAYNPLASHDYTVDKPTMREIIPGHFVHCNDAEEKRYKEEFGL
jgi:oligopeptide transport system ATP-binding protein